MLQLKEGVKLQGLQREMLSALDKAEAIYKFYGYDLIVTSARDAGHSHYSHHYKGLAVDLRTRHMSDGDPKLVSTKLQEALGTEYQVILEHNHIHVEYDPREMPS